MSGGPRTPGVGLTAAAAAGAYLPAGGYEVWDNFGDLADGALPAAAQSGQAYLYATRQGNTVALSGGKLVSSTEANIATYIMTALKKPGRRISARMTFGSSSTTGGDAGVILWATPIDSTQGNPIPDSPCHFVLQPEQWSWGVWQGNSYTVIGSGTFATPLTMDSATEYTVDLYLDRKGNTGYVVVTDQAGNVVLRASVNDSRVGSIPGNYTCIEHYRTASTQSLVQFTSWWADSRILGQSTLGKIANAMPERPAVVDYSVASLAYTPTTAWADVDATNLVIANFVPRTGTVLVTLTGYCKFTAGTFYSWGIRNGTSLKASLGLTDNVATPPNGMRTAQLIFTVTPGVVVNLKWAHITTVAASTTLSGDVGFFRHLTMRAECI